MKHLYCVLATLSIVAVAGPVPALAQAESPDIVISGTTARKPGEWRRAEGAHVVVLSRGSEDELVRVTRNLDRLHALMSRLYRGNDKTDEAVKLQVTLLDSIADFRSMALPALRSQEGPYQQAFATRTYYDPREDGAVLAIPRSDQVIDLDTTRANDLDCADALADGALECTAMARHWPAARSWEEVLYGAFARHFILTYRPANYPRWYLDGISALFSTTTMRKDGAIDYASDPASYRQVFRSYGNIDVASILTGQYLTADTKKLGWSPYHAWLLAHYFLYSKLKPDRARQFRDYMAAIDRGQPMAEAAQAFGDLKALQRDVLDYVETEKSFARTSKAQPAVEDPLVTTLSASAGKLVLARIELGSRLAALNAGGVEGERSRAWIAQLRSVVAGMPYDPEALLLDAEAECGAGLAAECQADADQVLGRSPDNARALTWKGIASTERAVAGPAADRAAGLASARDAILRAIALDDDAPEPVIAYFESFTKAGERVPPAAMNAMAGVIRRVPSAPAPRLMLATELLKQGNADLARRVATLILLSPYDSPEKKAAQALFPRAG